MITLKTKFCIKVVSNVLFSLSALKDILILSVQRTRVSLLLPPNDNELGRGNVSPERQREFDLHGSSTDPSGKTKRNSRRMLRSRTRYYKYKIQLNTLNIIVRFYNKRYSNHKLTANYIAKISHGKADMLVYYNCAF